MDEVFQAAPRMQNASHFQTRSGSRQSRRHPLAFLHVAWSRNLYHRTYGLQSIRTLSRTVQHRAWLQDSERSGRKIASQGREQARWAYNSAVFEVKKGIPAYDH